MTLSRRVEELLEVGVAAADRSHRLALVAVEVAKPGAVGDDDRVVRRFRLRQWPRQRRPAERARQCFRDQHRRNACGFQRH